jgi:hypothetical protein
MSIQPLEPAIMKAMNHKVFKKVLDLLMTQV